MTYTIAKNPLKNVKTNTRRSFDSRKYFYSNRSTKTGNIKLDQLIDCLTNIVNNNTNWVSIVYDAQTDVLNVAVERGGELQYKMEFHLVITDDTISYNIKVPKIDWKKVVKDAKPFNQHIDACNDNLTVIDTNHAELKLVVNAVKKHFAKYNLCKHFCEAEPACAVEHVIYDEDLIDLVDKHAKDVTMKRINALCKKYNIVAKPELKRDTFFYHNAKKAYNVCKLSDGTFILNVEVCTSYKLDGCDRQRELPFFFLTYYVNTKTGKITWRFADDKFSLNFWYSNFVCRKDDKIRVNIEIDQIGDWELNAQAKSYDDWFAKLGFSEYFNAEVGKLLANIKAKRGL